MITIRPARPEDAAQIITYARRVFAEPGVSLITLAEEFNPTTESSAWWPRTTAASSAS